MYDKVRTILGADSNVTDEVATTAFFDEEVAPGQKVPYLRISLVEGNVNDTKTSTSDVDQVRFVVQCYAKHLVTTNSEIGAKSLAELVRTSLDHYSGTVLGDKVYIRCDDTGQGWTEKAENGHIKAYEYEFEAYLTRGATQASYMTASLVYETSDFGTGNSWIHSGVTHTANDDGVADLLEWTSGSASVRLNYTFTVGGNYFIVCDFKKQDQSSDGSALLFYTNAGSPFFSNTEYGGQPRSVPEMGFLSDYTKFGFHQYGVASGDQLQIIIQRSGSEDSDCYVKNFQIYELTFSS